MTNTAPLTSEDATPVILTAMRGFSTSLHLLKRFHDTLNVLSTTRPTDQEMVSETVMTVLRKASEKISIGQTVNMVEVATAIEGSQPDAAAEIIRLVSIVGVTGPAVSKVAFFNPTARLGVWKRNSYVISVVS